MKNFAYILSSTHKRLLGVGMAIALSLLSYMNLAGAQESAALYVQRADGTKVPFEVELAVTPESQRKGLMHRRSIPRGQGMLFLYDAPAPRSFWMKDTLIPLDMLFFNQKGDLVLLHENAQPHSLKLISPEDSSICAVLEVAGGEAAHFGLKKGDKLFVDYASDCLR